GGEMSEYPKPGQVLLIDGLRVHHSGHEDVGDPRRVGSVETVFRDAYDFIGGVAEAEPAADDVRVAREAAAPGAPGDHGDGVRSGSHIVAGREKTAQRGLESEGVEHPAGDELNAQAFHLLVGSECQI